MTKTTDMLLAGLGFTGFRSFGTVEMQRIAPLTKVHLLAGPNNSGKSNVLTVARRVLPRFREGQIPEFDEVDRPILPGTSESPAFRLGIASHVDDERLAEVAQGRGNSLEMLRSVLQGPTFGAGSGGSVWFEFEVAVDQRGRPHQWVSTPEQVKDLGSGRFGPRYARDLSQLLTQQSGGGEGADAQRVLRHVIETLGIRASVPPLATIPAFRRIGPASGETAIDDEHGGPGLIERLARLQNPDFTRAEDKRRFGEISRFVATLFDDSHAHVEIPHDRETILIHHDGRRLPLENYGTGLHEVVILAAAATILSRHLVCIEEPEVHLHPTLQRKLLRYLCEHTDNQYLIATHSAHLLDAERASISAMRQENGTTRVASAITPGEVAAISADLGFQASDLVQSNAVVWVEGPSDRIYLRHWIRLLAPDLMEGIHYSLMFYGGSLLKYLSPEDPAIEDFVTLPRINRNFAVVIDSDRETAGARLGGTKRYIREAIERSPALGGIWVTKGYTIENYVPPSMLRAAVSEIHSGVTCHWAGGLYTNPLGKRQLRGRDAVDKTAVARTVVRKWSSTEEWPLDLKKQVRRLATMIRRANALPPL